MLGKLQHGQAYCSRISSHWLLTSRVPQAPFSLCEQVIPSKDLRGGRGTRGHGLVQADRCAREAAVLADLQGCQNVVSLLWAARLDGCTYLVMEHCGGGDLEGLLKVGQIKKIES